MKFTAVLLLVLSLGLSGCIIVIEQAKETEMPDAINISAAENSAHTINEAPIGQPQHKTLEAQ